MATQTNAAVDADDGAVVEWLWWEPPEIGDPDESTVGVWVIATGRVGPGSEEMPTCGDVVGAAPSDAPLEWLAAQCGCAPADLVRRDDFEVGLYARRPDGALDRDRVDRWITCRRFTIAMSAPRAARAR